MKALLLFILFACAGHPVKIPLPKTQPQGLKTPQLILPADADPDMKMAALAFKAYANSDEFYDYVRKNVTKLEAGNETNVESAISKYRTCLATHKPIEIVLKDYSRKNRTRVIGGWRKDYLAQNRYKKLNSIDRASHWIHELTHACGFTHFDNDIMVHPSIKRSWPYQIGHMFADFLNNR